MYVVMRFYHMVRSGISFKVNETFIELWQNSYESEDKSSTTISFCPDDVDEEDLGYSNLTRSNLHVAEDIFEFTDDISETNVDEPKDGSENDSLLVAYDADSVDSLWHENVFARFSLWYVEQFL